MPSSLSPHPLPERVRVYQLLPRLFGNVNETRRFNGSLVENGCGRFADINDAALAGLRAMGFTHLWLTGVLRQATATDYEEIGLYADDPDLLKGQAGSPYAIKDYFDVCPDYAEDPSRRLEEFAELVQRAHAHQLRVIIDFVANHVARCYRSLVRETTFSISSATRPAVARLFACPRPPAASRSARPAKPSADAMATSSARSNTAA